jgi:hypothetical protein
VKNNREGSAMANFRRLSRHFPKENYEDNENREGSAMAHFRRLSRHFPREIYEDNEKQDKRAGHVPFQETILAYT